MKLHELPTDKLIVMCRQYERRLLRMDAELTKITKPQLYQDTLAGQAVALDELKRRTPNLRDRST